MGADSEQVAADQVAADRVRMARLECLRDVVDVSPLHGGITNRNYRVRTADSEMVVRVSDEGSSVLNIDRHLEFLNTVAAAEAGAGPEVVEYRQGEGLLVVQWVQARTFEPSDVGRNLPRIAQALQVLHAGPAFAGRFDMFAVQERYLSLVRERGFRLPDRYEEFAPQVAAMRAAMAKWPEDLVPCNNDLLAGNILDAGDRLWLIDYEYSGQNEPSFELGNVWSEASLPGQALPELVGAYWGEVTAAKVARARLWALMSKYGWTLWASIQDAISPLEFDYWSWGMEKYERACEEFDGPDFQRLLTDVAGH